MTFHETLKMHGPSMRPRMSYVMQCTQCCVQSIVQLYQTHNSVVIKNTHVKGPVHCRWFDDECKVAKCKLKATPETSDV